MKLFKHWLEIKNLIIHLFKSNVEKIKIKNEKQIIKWKTKNIIYKYNI